LWAAGAVLLGVAASAAGLLWAGLRPADPGGAPVAFEVRPGAGLGEVTRSLQKAGLVRRAWALRTLARWRGLETQIRAGEYELSPGQPAGLLLAKLVAGEVQTHRFVVPEGRTAAQIAAQLETAGLAQANAFLLVVRDPRGAARLGVEGDSLEGYLFPETYQLARGLPPEEIARILVEQFLRNWQEIAPLARAWGLSMHEVVTLASIVEKETAAPEERPKIAAVFENRLARGMRLETDPAVIYGIPNFDGNLRRSDLEDASNPYNTYRIRGLPPGPIANPGAASLRAVVEPAPVDYLYFVSRNDGTHIFSRTYREHAAAVDRFQKRRHRRRGPSTP